MQQRGYRFCQAEIEKIEITSICTRFWNNRSSVGLTYKRSILFYALKMQNLRLDYIAAA